MEVAMRAQWPYPVLADAVLVLHFAVVLFVIGGLVLVVVGNRLAHWPWVNGVWFRAAHLVAIGVVVAQSWFGMVCPLTTLEAWLREQAGEPTYHQSFVAYWLRRLMFFEAPDWVFAVAYTVFGLLVVVTWWRYPPPYAARSRR
jgi:hypothetical protein